MALWRPRGETSAAGRVDNAKKRTPSASISFSGAIGSSPAESLASTTEKDWSRKAPGGVVVIHRHPRAGDEVIRGRGYPGSRSFRENAASWMTPAPVSGSALADWTAANGGESGEEKGAKRVPTVAAKETWDRRFTASLETLTFRQR